MDTHSRYNKKSFYKKGKDNSDDIIEVDYKDLDEK